MSMKKYYRVRKPILDSIDPKVDVSTVEEGVVDYCKDYIVVDVTTYEARYHYLFVFAEALTESYKIALKQATNKSPLDDRNRTPLHWAAYMCNEPVAEARDSMISLLRRYGGE